MKKTDKFRLGESHPNEVYATTHTGDSIKEISPPFDLHDKRIGSSPSKEGKRSEPAAYPTTRAHPVARLGGFIIFGALCMTIPKASE